MISLKLENHYKNKKRSQKYLKTNFVDFTFHSLKVYLKSLLISLKFYYLMKLDILTNIYQKTFFLNIQKQLLQLKINVFLNHQNRIFYRVYLNYLKLNLKFDSKQ